MTSTPCEPLESRQLLSATVVAHPNLSVSPLASTSVFQGYTPAQIRHAYGFDQITGDGSGQTIAIVDAFRDPNIVADLHAFDLKMGIADPPSFKIVSQTGGSASAVKADAGWSAEIALDIEWAHAIAPKANILLVSANSDSLADLMSGVDVARRAAGVSVVSMSWGSSEFAGQTYWDKYFTTPAGHQGVTFVASSGDSGSSWGVSWPSSSPSVLSVGGTSLYTTGANGTYSTEIGWSGSGGGTSQVYRTPSYQTAAQTTGVRTNPDVAYNANPSTGFAVYDSVSDAGQVGWQVIGGTSAGAPQWAALIAIANQMRAAVGKISLDGLSGTLPALYKLYSAPTSATYATYTANFNDIASGRSSWFMSAHTGYDGVTGLGTPKVPQVVAALSAAAATVTTTPVTRTRAARVASRAAAAAAITNASVTLSAASSSVAIAANLLKPDFHLSNSASDSSITARTLFASDIAVPQTTLSAARQSLAGAPTALSFIFSHTPISTDIAALASSAASNAFDMASPTLNAADAATLAIPAAIQLESSIPLAAFADALSTFAHESASIGATLMTDSPVHLRTWAIAFAVLTADGILIASWLGSRRQRSAKGHHHHRRHENANTDGTSLPPGDDDSVDHTPFSITRIAR